MTMRNRRILLLFYQLYAPYSRKPANKSLLVFWKAHSFFVPDYLSQAISDIAGDLSLRRRQPRVFLYSHTNDAGRPTKDFNKFIRGRNVRLNLDLKIDQFYSDLLRDNNRPPRFKRPWVMLHVRDNAFLTQSFPWRDWSHNSFRDSDIHIFNKAILDLLSKGYAVVRAGRIARRPLAVQDPNVLDLPFSSGVTEEEENFLWSNCAFALSTDSGPGVAAAVCNRPLFHVEALPIFLDSNSVFIECIRFVRRLAWYDEGRDLSWSELRELSVHTWFTSTQYEASGVRILAATPAEIQGIVSLCEQLALKFGAERKRYGPRQRLYPWT
jgi:putative glycosyltransferase (TIGR04372 family)